MQPWRSRPDTSRADGASPPPPAASAAAAAASHSSARGTPLSVSPGTLAGTPPASGVMAPAHSAPSAATPATSIAPRWTTFTHDASGGDRRRAADEESSCAVRALYFDGCGLLATSDGGCVRLWSLERRRRICTLKTTSGKDEVRAPHRTSRLMPHAWPLSPGLPSPLCRVAAAARWRSLEHRHRRRQPALWRRRWLAPSL